jgi:hypothetical protein
MEYTCDLSVLTPRLFPRYRTPTVPESDDDELLRLLILAVLAKADRPVDAEELAERVTAMLGVRLGPERGH